MDDWRIEAILKSGVPLERSASDLVVELGYANLGEVPFARMIGKEEQSSSADMRAVKRWTAAEVRDLPLEVNLLVECKYLGPLNGEPQELVFTAIKSRTRPSGILASSHNAILVAGTETLPMIAKDVPMSEVLTRWIPTRGDVYDKGFILSKGKPADLLWKAQMQLAYALLETYLTNVQAVYALLQKPGIIRDITLKLWSLMGPDAPRISARLYAPIILTNARIRTLDAGPLPPSGEPKIVPFAKLADEVAFVKYNPTLPGQVYQHTLERLNEFNLDTSDLPSVGLALLSLVGVPTRYYVTTLHGLPELVSELENGFVSLCNLLTASPTG